MRSFVPWTVLLSLAALPACDGLRDADPPATPTETATASTLDPTPLHTSEAGCLPKTTAVLDDATRALAAHDGLKGEAMVRDAEGTYQGESRSSSCATDIGERVRVRRLALRHAAMRMGHADDLDVLLDLGNESFDTSLCKEALVATCEDARAWFAERFPAFVEGPTIAIRPMDRLPITPQPGGRLTVEYMQTLDNRLALVPGDYFAMTVAPTVRIDATASSEIRVDGADVLEEGDDCLRVAASAKSAPVSGDAQGAACPKERKTGAHVSLRVPTVDLTRTNASDGAVVVVVRKSDFHHGGATWRGNARVAFSTR